MASKANHLTESLIKTSNHKEKRRIISKAAKDYFNPIDRELVSVSHQNNPHHDNGFRGMELEGILARSKKKFNVHSTTNK